MRFRQIYQVRPGGNPHAACLDHVARAFASASGLPLEIGRPSMVPDRSIIIGGHLIVPGAMIGHGCAVWNTEQVFAASPWLNKTYRRVCAVCELWDYDARNVSAWREMGHAAKLCRLLHDPAMVSPALAEPGRVPWFPMFYGSSCPRREGMVEATGCRRLPVLYGADLDAELARALVVLNVHFYPAMVLETVRLSYLWANAIPVLSEDYAGTSFWRRLMPPGTFAPYSQMASRLRDGQVANGEAQRIAYETTSLRDELAPLL